MNRMSKKFLCQISTLLIAIGSHNITITDKREEGFWDREDLVERRTEAKNVRFAAAIAECKSTAIRVQRTNGDLYRYNDHRGTYSKALAHDANGIVTQESLNSLIDALKSGESNEFDTIILGGSRRLGNPQGSYAFSLEGADVAKYTIRRAPAFSSAEQAGEMVELYWQALLRDVPFNQYATNPIAAEAIADLNTLSDFRGPRINGQVTAQTLFRGLTSGDLTGPYISQFLYQPVPNYGRPVAQNYFYYQAGLDYLTDVDDLLLVENGGSTGQVNQFAANSTFIRNGRDLGSYVDKDYSSQIFINTALILLGYGRPGLDANNPYKSNPTQDGFVTYGGPKVIELVNTATNTALKACWYQKWLNHLRLRPEEFGFFVQQQKANGINYRINSDLINSPVLTEIFNLYGTYLLPQMYPAGSPTHPAYPSGHAAIAGASVTILKAFFNEGFAIPVSVQPNNTNTALVPYVGSLLVGNELNKLATNVGMGRDIAGIHWRTDCLEGMLLGENIGISILEDEAYTNNENFNGFVLTKFNGETIVIGKKITVPASDCNSCN